MVEAREKMAKNAEYDRNTFWLYKYLKTVKGKIYKGFVSRIFENNRVLVFIPELLHEFLFRLEYESDAQEGTPIFLRLQHASPRKRRAHWIQIRQSVSCEENPIASKHSF